MNRFNARWSARKAGVVLACVLLGWFVAGRVEAQVPDTPAARVWDGGWKAGLDEEPARETVSGEVMVVAAYMALWVILLLYVVRLSAGLKALQRDAEALQRRLDEAGGA